MLVVVKSDMAVIHDQIKELENGLRKLCKMADAINPERFGYKQQKAILSFADGCRNVQGWHLGELKNAFGMGIKTKMSPSGKLEIENGKAADEKID